MAGLLPQTLRFAPDNVQLHLPPDADPALSWTGTQDLVQMEHTERVSLDAQVVGLPTVMTIDEFMDVLNHGRPEDEAIVTKRGLINNAERFGLFKLTERGPWLVPLATVKQLRGLATA